MTRLAPPARRLHRGQLAVGAYGLVVAVLGGALVVQPLVGDTPGASGVLVTAANGPPPLSTVGSAATTQGIVGDSVRALPQAPSGGPAARAPLAPVGQEREPGSAVRPDRLVLPSGRRARVLAAGVHPDGVMVIPENPADVGWWTGGALVGEPYGSVVLAGHVDSRTFGKGVLAELRTLRVGEELTAGTAQRPVRYRIVDITQVSKARLAAGADIFRQDTGHRLVVITCGGEFDRKRHTYADNLVVTAVPVG